MISVALLVNMITLVYSGAQPNFIIFYLDDIKYTQSWHASIPPGTSLNTVPLHYYDIPTPNINRIMNEGIVFQRSYTAAPQCSPSRYALLTGRYPSRSQYAVEETLKTSDGYEGTRITNANVKLTKPFEVSNPDSIFNMPAVVQYNGYYTGMVGKWHLMTSEDNGHNYLCARLDAGMNEMLYDECKDLIKCQGFDFVDGWYHENIPAGLDYTHNPEWMVSVSQDFIHEAHEEHKPFFLYFASTIGNTYTPIQEIIDPEQTMYNYSLTPGGILYGHDVPTHTGMSSRAHIWEQTLHTLDVNGITSTNAETQHIVNMIGATIWIDDAIGAMVEYLESNELLDNTFIVIANDNGYDAKGTLYEHGSRIFQFVRYPPLFDPRMGSNDGNGPIVMGDDFIVANYDLAPVIFAVSESVVPAAYVMDGQSWLPEVLAEIEGSRTQGMAQCCTERYIEVYNTRGIVTKNNKYIFMATAEVRTESPPEYNTHPHLLNKEQLYRLKTDPTEQHNVIGEIDRTTKYEFRSRMSRYIETVTCIGEDQSQCTAPTILDRDIPSYSCNSEVAYAQIFYDVNDYNPSDKLRDAERAIIASDIDYSQKCVGLDSISDWTRQEYVYSFDESQERSVALNMILCCGNGRSFGIKYQNWPTDWTRNRVYNGDVPWEYPFESVLNSEGSETWFIFSGNDWYLVLIIATFTVLSVLYYGYYKQKTENGNQKFELFMTDSNQLQIEDVNPFVNTRKIEASNNGNQYGSVV